MLKEFQKFISRGNVIDLAVGVIIGGAFGKITASLVNDIVMPPIGLMLSGINFKELKLVLGGTQEAPISINYGNFIQICIEFIVIAFVVFLLIKFINNLKKKEDAKPAPAPAPPAPSKEEVLLAEIRDILKNK